MHKKLKCFFLDMAKAFPRATMERSAFEQITELIDTNKDKMSDGEYMAMMNAMKAVHDNAFFKDAVSDRVITTRILHEAPAPAPAPEPRRCYVKCSACGEEGHNKRNLGCPVQMANRAHNVIAFGGRYR